MKSEGRHTPIVVVTSYRRNSGPESADFVLDDAPLLLDHIGPSESASNPLLYLLALSQYGAREGAIYLILCDPVHYAIFSFP